MLPTTPKSIALRSSLKIGAIVALAAIASCSSQSASNLLPEHAREVLRGKPPTDVTAATPPATGEPSQSSQSADSWLGRINYFRAMAGLDPVSADAKMSDGDLKHARYLVKNYAGSSDLGLDAHREDKQNKWYTPEGYIAARTSDVIPASTVDLTEKQAIDLWISGPFHRFPILNPALKQAGFGSYSEDGESAMAMQLRMPSAYEDPGAPSPSHGSFIHETPPDDQAQADAAAQRVVEFPPANSNFPLAAFSSGEWPDPLASCPGYRTPTGFPITIQLGVPTKMQIQSTKLMSNDQPLEVCEFDASNYRGADETQTATGRLLMHNNGAAVLIPRARLHSGQSYEVTIVANGKQYQWTFRVASAEPAKD